MPLACSPRPCLTTTCHDLPFLSLPTLTYHVRPALESLGLAVCASVLAAHARRREERAFNTSFLYPYGEAPSRRFGGLKECAATGTTRRARDDGGREVERRGDGEDGDGWRWM